jgi:hypothetical protein
MIWTDDRCEELESLRNLLWKISSINSRSGFLQKLVECEELAKRLLEIDYGPEGLSFIEFLNAQAIKEREK